jgi:hypothetical protein
MFFRGLIPDFFQARKARLDQDRDQHHLASMLVSIAAGRDEVTRVVALAREFTISAWSPAGHRRIPSFRRKSFRTSDKPCTQSHA